MSDLASRIIWYVGLAVRADGTVDRYVRKDGKLQRIEGNAK